MFTTVKTRSCSPCATFPPKFKSFTLYLTQPLLLFFILFTSFNPPTQHQTSVVAVCQSELGEEVAAALTGVGSVQALDLDRGQGLRQGVPAAGDQPLEPG